MSVNTNPDFEEVMEKRRLERLQVLIFFMTAEETLNLETRKVLSLGSTHCLLTGFFHNSDWQAAWFCFRKALESSRISITLNLRLAWYVKVLRLNDEQIEERLSQ